MKKLLFICIAICISLVASAQNVIVTGVVKDALTDEPIVGANVVQKGHSSNGTMTDFKGEYIITVPCNSTLVYSAFTYENREERVDDVQVNTIVINVSLFPDPQLGEINLSNGWLISKGCDMVQDNLKDKSE